MTARELLRTQPGGWVYRGVAAGWDRGRDEAFVAAALEANELAAKALPGHVNWPFPKL